MGRHRLVILEKRVRGTGILTLNISVVKLIIGKTEVFCEERL